MHATRPKNIQIEYSFFLDLISYAFLHEDSNDIGYQRIVAAFRRKLEAMERHDLYSLYKSGASEDLRQKAREEYLDMLGIRESLRWNSNQDVNVAHDLDAMIPDLHSDRGATHEQEEEILRGTTAD